MPARKRGEDWGRIAEDIANRILTAIDYYCNNVAVHHGEDPIECIDRYTYGYDVYELAEKFLKHILEPSAAKRDLQLLGQMPERYVREVERIVRSTLEKWVREEMKERKKMLKEWGYTEEEIEEMF